MAKSRKQLREEMKMIYVDKLNQFLGLEEDVLRVGSNELAFPIIDEEGNEDFIVVTCKIPTGANKGTEPYDGYAMAEEYTLKQNEKKEKAKKSAEAKAKKIQRDKIYREKKEKMKKEQE